MNKDKPTLYQQGSHINNDGSYITPDGNYNEIGYEIVGKQVNCSFKFKRLPFYKRWWNLLKLHTIWRFK